MTVVGDLDPDRRVYVTSHARGGGNTSNGDGRPSVHTDPDCQVVRTSEGRFYPKRAAVLHRDHPICRYCTNEYRPNDTGTGALARWLASEDVGPEDAGLSPVGRDGGMS